MPKLAEQRKAASPRHEHSTAPHEEGRWCAEDPMSGAATSASLGWAELGFGDSAVVVDMEMDDPASVTASDIADILRGVYEGGKTWSDARRRLDGLLGLPWNSSDILHAQSWPAARTGLAACMCLLPSALAHGTGVPRGPGSQLLAAAALHASAWTTWARLVADAAALGDDSFVCELVVVACAAIVVSHRPRDTARKPGVDLALAPDLICALRAVIPADGFPWDAPRRAGARPGDGGVAGSASDAVADGCRHEAGAVPTAARTVLRMWEALGWAAGCAAPVLHLVSRDVSGALAAAVGRALSCPPVDDGALPSGQLSVMECLGAATHGQAGTHWLVRLACGPCHGVRTALATAATDAGLDALALTVATREGAPGVPVPGSDMPGGGGSAGHKAPLPPQSSLQLVRGTRLRSDGDGVVRPARRGGRPGRSLSVSKPTRRARPDAPTQFHGGDRSASVGRGAIAFKDPAGPLRRGRRRAGAHDPPAVGSQAGSTAPHTFAAALAGAAAILGLLGIDGRASGGRGWEALAVAACLCTAGAAQGALDALSRARLMSKRGIAPSRGVSARAAALVAAAQVSARALHAITWSRIAPLVCPELSACAQRVAGAIRVCGLRAASPLEAAAIPVLAHATAFACASALGHEDPGLKGLGHAALELGLPAVSAIALPAT